MAPMKSGQKADGVVIVVTCMCPSIHKHVCGHGGGDNGPDPFEMPSAICAYKTYSFNHSHTEEKYKIKCFISCSTTNVTYMLKCPCGLAYIGKST